MKFKSLILPFTIGALLFVGCGKSKDINETTPNTKESNDSKK